MNRQTTIELDPNTGRPFGDHGTGAQAIEWLLHVCKERDHYNREAFLEDWQCGAAYEEWPEYYEWLNAQ